MDDALVEVTQADRDAAATQIAWQIDAEQRYERDAPFFHLGLPDGIRRGVWDEHEVVQAFSRHRLAGVKEGLEMAAKECRHVAENAVLVLDEHDARIRHEGIVAGANVCAIHIDALGPRP